MKLPNKWTAIPVETGSQSKGEVHPGLVSGISIRGEDFNGVYCIGAVGEETFVIADNYDGYGYSVYVLRRSEVGGVNKPELVFQSETPRGLFSWLAENAGAELPFEIREEMLENKPTFSPSYHVHTYAVVRVKTIGVPNNLSPDQLAKCVSEGVCADSEEWLVGRRGRISPRREGEVLPSCDVECVEFGDEIAGVLVDELDEDGNVGRSYWYDKNLEFVPTGTSTAYELRLEARVKKLEEFTQQIARMVKDGETAEGAHGKFEFVMENDDAVDTLNVLISEARALALEGS